MTTLAFVPQAEAAATVVAWVQALGDGEAPPAFLCWEGAGGDRTQEAVRVALGEAQADVSALRDPDPIAAVASRCVDASATLLVTTQFELSGGMRPRTTSALVTAAPCRTFVALYGERGPSDARTVLVYLDGTAHDRAVVEAARTLATTDDIAFTAATVEPDIGRGADEVGRRELRSALHDAGVEEPDAFEWRVVVDNHPIRGMLRAAEGHDLVIVGATAAHLVVSLEQALHGTTVAVVKRKPPLRRWAVPDWIPRINPSDYAELVQDLRAGSRWRANFWVMLAMAAAIASLGLLQNSAAVVIGSMLLAPLMTPMIGFGLALVQANPSLGRLCLTSVGLGVALTLVISFGIGWLTPGGVSLSPEVLSRCEPNVLDLAIAFCAAIAAAFALARPGIAGAVAGVAIATALVPPLCSIGISLAHAELLNALGATILFGTNFLAIVLGASLTFTLLGVSADRALPLYRRSSRHVVGALVLVLLALAVPLGMMLTVRIDMGRNQPLAYPVTRKVVDALTDRVQREDGMELLLVARPAKAGGVIIHLAADDDVDRSFGDELTDIVRKQMHDQKLTVRVVAVRRAWVDS